MKRFFCIISLLFVLLLLRGLRQAARPNQPG